VCRLPYRLPAHEALLPRRLGQPGVELYLAGRLQQIGAGQDDIGAALHYRGLGDPGDQLAAEGEHDHGECGPARRAVRDREDIHMLAPSSGAKRGRPPGPGALDGELTRSSPCRTRRPHRVWS
jgi:hypothetical protein